MQETGKTTVHEVSSYLKIFYLKNQLYLYILEVGKKKKKKKKLFPPLAKGKEGIIQESMAAEKDKSKCQQNKIWLGDMLKFKKRISFSSLSTDINSLWVDITHINNFNFASSPWGTTIQKQA